MSGLFKIIFAHLGQIFSQIIFTLEIFGGLAKVRCMKDYSKLPLRENPVIFILHVATNNLNSNRELELIPKLIADDNWSMIKEIDNVTISNIVIRNNNFKEKATEIDELFKTFVKIKKYFLSRKAQHSKTKQHSKYILSKFLEC